MQLIRLIRIKNMLDIITVIWTYVKKGTAHDTPREDPVAFNKVVREFMEALEKE
ncbi:MAG TPA: hypothetical protein GXZ59_08305 [Clostridiaceae bacterium]|nr:hypothetical protein [Clostridiaceae bacterium]